MARIAIFVDAGYLLAQGSVALTGEKRQRASLRLDITGVVRELKQAALRICDGKPLLRIYWYDGARGYGNLPPDHSEIAHHSYVKLRLGMINSAGNQKGVDSLIVTDLIELARNRAIDEAILVSGDDDVRIGVSIAQAYGTCVHLMGIEAESGAAQAELLIQEADTRTTWHKEDVSRFLIWQDEDAQSQGSISGMAIGDASAFPESRRDLGNAVDNFVNQLSTDEMRAAADHRFSGQRGLPFSLDRRLLPLCRQAIQRDLNEDEKRFMRDRAVKSIGERYQAQATVNSAP